MSGHTFFTFRRPPDWTSGIVYQLESGNEGLSIIRERIYRHQSRYPLDHPEYSGNMVDVVADLNGRWHALDANRTIWRIDAANRQMDSLIQLEPYEDYRPIGIAVTADSIVALYEGQSSMLQALQADRAQIRWTTKDWYGESFHALSVAADDADGWLVVAAIGSAEELQLLQFDAAGSPMIRIPLTFIKRADRVDQESEYGTRFQIMMGEAGKAFLLDKVSQQLIQIHLFDQRILSVPLPIDGKKEKVLSFCFSTDSLIWLLLRTQDEAMTSHTLAAMTSEGEFVQRGFTGNASGEVIVAGKKSLYLWNNAERSVYRIEPISEPAVWEAFGSRMGIWMSDGLDSGELETEWHKLVLDARQHNDTQINIRYYVSDQREVMIDQERVDLDSYISNQEVAVETKLAALTPLWSKAIKDPKDALLHQAKGRYLWLFIELIGSSKHAPVIQSLEVHFPRQSYLEYLPSIYGRDERSSDFLSRYLSLFQTMLEQTESKIREVTRTLEAKNAAGPSLRWLLGWLGIDADDYWSEDQLRQLLQAAPELYALRGTKTALERLIQIYTGEKPIILEYEQVKPLKENNELGEVADRLYAADPHMFNVLVKAENADTEMKRITLQQLIEAYKPVFASFKLIILQPWVYMDLHSYLGMNTVLSEPTLLTLDGRSSMPHHTITIDVGQDNRMDQHTRLGLNSRLE